MARKSENIVYIALGSNVGNSKEYISDAVTLLSKYIKNISISPTYLTKAVGYTDQADYLNAAISGETSLEPLKLLNVINEIEKKLGRIKRFRWGPREIDIDIIFYGSQIINEPQLIIPHPRFKERDFVLKPIETLDPNFLDPISQKKIKQLLDELPINSRSIIKESD